MKFEQKEVLRARRDLKNIINALLSSHGNIYTANLKRLIDILQENNVLNIISKPYFDHEVNFNEIERFKSGGRGLDLPIDVDDEIAFVLQRIKNIIQENAEIETYAFAIFGDTDFDVDIMKWNNEILEPCLKELLDKIDDLIEDEVKNHEVVDSSKLNIVNNGSINVGSNANIAMGENIDQKIDQNINDNHVFDELRKAAQSINDETKQEILSRIDDMERNKGKKSFSDKYNAFIQSAANHMTVFLPFIPALTKLLTNCH